MLGRPNPASRSGPAGGGKRCSARRRSAPPPSEGHLGLCAALVVSPASFGTGSALGGCWPGCPAVVRLAAEGGYRTLCRQPGPGSAASAQPAGASGWQGRPGCRAPGQPSDARPGEPRCHPLPGAAWSPLPGAGPSSLLCTPLFGRHRATVQHGVLPVQTLLLVQSTQEGLPKAIPHPFPIPAGQPSPAGDRARVLGRHVLPPTPRGRT
jgi:hypothetical protein